jgi:hypothetical protein
MQAFSTSGSFNLLTCLRGAALDLAVHCCYEGLLLAQSLNPKNLYRKARAPQKEGRFKTRSGHIRSSKTALFPHGGGVTEQRGIGIGRQVVGRTQMSTSISRCTMLSSATMRASATMSHACKIC